MSYEEEDTFRIYQHSLVSVLGYMSYEEEDTCHMRRRIHVI